ncbi:alpha-amylase family glycosyl hydrolase, partial [Deinococcus arenicola]
EPVNPDWDPSDVEHNSVLHTYTQDQPETHQYIREMRQVLDEFDDRMMVGEIYLPVDQLLPYAGAQDAQMVHLPFNFHLILRPWQAQAVREFADSYDAACNRVGTWPNWVLGNHDQRRFKGRVGAAQYRVAQTLLLTLRGTPTVYYGDEIGMDNVTIPRDRMVDPAGLQQLDVPSASRDPERTPMQWDATPNAGFAPAQATPWLPLADDFAAVNVEAQEADPHSDLHYFRALTALRQQQPALVGGDYASVDSGAEQVFAFRRTLEGQSVTVLLNFGAGEHDLGDIAKGQTLLSSLNDQPANGAKLRANEARIILN